MNTNKLLTKEQAAVLYSTPIVDALAEVRHEPYGGLIWANDARKIERDRNFYRELLQQIAEDPRRTKARRLAESGLAFWDALQSAKTEALQPKE